MFKNIIFIVLVSIFFSACQDKNGSSEKSNTSSNTSKVKLEENTVTFDKEKVNPTENNNTNSENNDTNNISLDQNKTSNTDQQDNNTSFIEEDENNSTLQENNQTTDLDDINRTKIWKSYLETLENNKTTYTGDIQYPHYKPTTIIASYNFDDVNNYNSTEVWLDGAKYDVSQKRSGDRSVRFSMENNTLALEKIPVKEGRWYVISGYMYVKSQPADVMRYYIEYLHNDEPLDIPNYPMVAISRANQWEEFILPVYIKKDLDVSHIRLVFRNVGTPDAKNAPKSDVWIDDIIVYEVLGSASLFGLMPPGKKRVFDGALVKVDALGNFSLKEGNTFKPFLPIIIYPGGKMDNWDKYKSKGFNTIICNSIAEAKKAVSLGMHWIWSLYDYGIYDGDTSGYARFEKEYKQLRSDSPEVLKKLLYFYWDNERYLLFDTVHHFTKTIHEIDVDESGKRLRPFTMQLDFTTANPHYVNELYQLVDLQSCYANPMIFEENDPQNYQGVEFKGNYDGEFANFAIFEHIPGVRIPKSVFVINSPFGDKHIANTIFAAFARGGRGFAYWKDGGSQPAIETKVWWKDFNQTVDKMQKVLPLLRTPHWTDWKLESSLRDDEDGLVMGTRDFGDKRCMIVASRSNKEEKVRFSGLGTADGTVVIDYFTGAKAAVWKEGAFELSFSARGYGVYCWDSAKE